jgi:ABC-2 type transport system permease protein
VSHVFSDVAVLFRREILRYARDRAYWIGQIVFPLALVGFVGFGLDDVVSLPSGTGFVAHLASGVLALLVGSGAVGGGFSLIEDRESGFLRALLVAPVSRASIVLGKLAARTVVSLALVLLLACCLALVTPLDLPNPAAALLAVVGVTAVFVALGVALATRLRRLESFRLVAALVTVPLYLFSGIFYPLATLPAPLRLPAYANPMTYGADLLRFGLLGVHDLPVALSATMLVGLGVVAVAGSIWLFDRGVRG